MTISDASVDREKVTSKLPESLRAELKVRAAEHRIDIQDAVTEAIQAWRQQRELPTADTSGADSFSTWLPAGLYEEFKTDCATRQVSYIQGLAQAVTLWLEQHPSPRSSGQVGIRVPQRIIVANQKGGVGKTAVAAGVAQARAEGVEFGGPGLRTLLIDFDPQGHLTNQLGAATIPLGGDSLVKHMTGEATGHIKELIVPVEDERFGDRLWLLPSCADGFVLDVKLSTTRAREEALERALEPLEEDIDVVVVDCPPSLGLAMDTAIHYGRRRAGEDPGSSGILIPVEADDSSADAFTLLTAQIEDLSDDMRVDVDYLGLVVNKFDSRRGYVATSSLQGWQSIGDPPVVAVVGDLKEQREAVRRKQPLLAYQPNCQQSHLMRSIAKEIS
ncbi:ParA family protein [Marinactinospora endophytica]